jgi:hypothetical protein
MDQYDQLIKSFEQYLQTCVIPLTADNHGRITQLYMSLYRKENNGRIMDYNKRIVIHDYLKGKYVK